MDARRCRDHRHGGARTVGDLLQLRQLRGSARLDGRQRRPRAHRRADRRHGRQTRRQPVPRRRARLLRQRQPAGVEHSRGADHAGGPRHRRHLGSHHQEHRLRLRSRRPADPQPRVVLRLVLAPGRRAVPPHDPGDRSHAARRSEPQDQLAGDAEGHGQLPVLQRLQDQGSSQAGPGDDRSAGSDVPSGQFLQRQLAAARPVEGRGRSRARLERVPVDEVRLLQHRRRADARGRVRRAGRLQRASLDHVRQHPAAGQLASAAHRDRRRALVLHEAGRHQRRQVRRRLPHDRRHHREHVAGQRHPRDLPDGHRSARAGVPRRPRRQSCQLPARLRRRHALPHPDDDHRRRALRSPVGQRRREHDRVEPGVPGARAGDRVPGLPRAVHLEQPVAARQLHLLARRVAQDQRARELQQFRRPARDVDDRLHEPGVASARLPTAGPTPTAIASRRRTKSTPPRCCQRAVST